MHISFWLRNVWVLWIVIVVTSSCGSVTSSSPVSNQVEASATPQPVVTTTKADMATLTDSPEPEPTEEPLTLTPSLTPEPLARATLAPTETQIPPTETSTQLPVPTFERTLALQSPFLEGQDVLILQEQLLLLGYNQVGTPDGVFGGMTDTAVRQFQTDQGLVVDGIVGQQTWEALFRITVDHAEETTPAETTVYYLGSSGNKVGEINSRLFDLSYPICELDRIFDAQTEFAVRQFQTVNDLESDGVVGPNTWDLLFSENALPVPQPETQLNFSSPVEVGVSYGLGFDGKNIWLARNDFGADNDALSKIDPNSGTGIARIEIEEFSGAIRHLHPTLVYPAKDILWVGGRASSGTETGTPTLVAVKTSGKLVGDPIFVGTSNIEISAVVEFFSDGNTVWAVVNEPHTVLYQLSSSPVKSLRRLTPYDVFDATGAAFDGTRLWLAAYKGQTFAVWAVNLENGAVGQVLGVCADKLAFDGKWVWASQANQLVAVDPETGQVMATAPFKGYLRGITSDGKGHLWLLTSYDADTFLQSLKTR